MSGAKAIAVSCWLSGWVVAGAAGSAARAASHPDGTLLEQAACPANPITTYEQYLEGRKQGLAQEVAFAKDEGLRIETPADLTPFLLSREDFAKRVAYAGFECWRIRYASDGLAVAGYLWKPKDTAGKKLPLIVFNRGGNREFSALVPWMNFGFYDYLAGGFVVLASQYRGNAGGEGREEFGGADVRDVLHLLPLASSLGYVDMRNVFLFGWSRGGMETLLALKAGMAVNAAAVGGALIDLPGELMRRPGFSDVWAALIPGFPERGDQPLLERSAIQWPEKIQVPLLILQGGADWRVDAGGNALALAQKLQALGKTYELIVYAGDDHGLSRNAADADRRVMGWFKRHMR
jgi:dipeptidyl aminopeptidase/acylaminoacyl peptidase